MGSGWHREKREGLVGSGVSWAGLFARPVGLLGWTARGKKKERPVAFWLHVRGGEEGD